jgi:hypothetical protein
MNNTDEHLKEKDKSHLNEKDLYFVATYYFTELHGKYPLVQEDMAEILKHYIRNILRLHSNTIELQIINLLYDTSRSIIIKTGLRMFPTWKKRKDNHERIIMLAENLLRIQRLYKKVGTPAKVVEDDQGQEKNQSFYSNIEEYAEKTGKRFRMPKDHKEQGLTREQSFHKLYGDH